jgi:hypothetical protein
MQFKMVAENQIAAEFQTFQNQGICIPDFSSIAFVQTKKVRLVCFLADLKKIKMAKILQISSFSVLAIIQDGGGIQDSDFLYFHLTKISVCQNVRKYILPTNCKRKF